MRSGLLHVLAWTLATGAAVTLSWWGVHTVMAGTAYDPPRALPLTVSEVTSSAGASDPPPSPGTGPAVSPTPSPSSSPSASPAARSASAAPSRAATTPAAPRTTPAGTVKSYDTDGGRVVLDLTATYATLVSATPAAGWSVQVWKTESWIRVDFASGADRVSVFCTWHDGPPRVDVQTF
ncbi:hypothetical protein ABZ490_09195 [Streptomyces sp. NPDC005811]|uniref:hypothetical protein n=1 Tax=Streptomyces sp. NPDC005811 TaxID=3154565 RepID=UPI0033EC1E86